MCKHRHTPEIEQILQAKDRVVFTPHLAPLKRGLLSTVTLRLTQEAAAMDVEEAVEAYRSFYEDAPLVTVLDAGAMPRTASVAGTCRCQIGLAVDPRTGVLVATGAIDNLCKGLPVKLCSAPISSLGSRSDEVCRFSPCQSSQNES